MELYEIRKALMSGKTIYDLPLRVTYYARVSTGKNEQKNSLINQDDYYKNKILSIPKWTLVQGYSDSGITGTSIKKREDFNNMIQDGMDDKYDLILTKEVCRFARNTLDTLQFTRNLLARGKGIYFELDNINTLEQEGELRLTLMASLAQDESRRISERVKFGFNRAIEKGRVLGSNVIWGYEKDNCKLKKIDEEAEIVSRIFELYSTGNIGIRRIGKKLAEEGKLTRKGDVFAYSTIKNILTNPKYKGCYCGKKTEVIDFMSKERIEIPKEEWITYKAEENIVPQIVNDDIWQKCNEIMEKRSNKYTGTGDRWNNQYQYSNLLICTNDGKKFWRRKHRPTAKEEFWICSEYAKNGLKNCNNHTYIGTEELNSILSEVFSELLEKKSMILKEMLKANSRLDKKDFKLEKNIKILENAINEKEKNKANLIKLYTMNKITDDEFEKIKNEYQDEIMDYKSQLIQLKVNRDANETGKNQQKIKKFFDFDTFELTKEFIHEKIDRIYVQGIEKNHVKLKINFHLGLEMSEVDKKSICLGLIIYLTGTVAKDKIETVKFEMGKEPTDVNIISEFDASEKQDGSIIGYYTDKDNNGLYELTFVSEEVIYANESAKSLFCNLNNVKEFKFYNFSTFKVKEFNYMFYACFLVTDLDISSFDTSYATYINGMFCECRNLQTIDLKNFDTSKVIDMRDMFGDCYSLSNINFGEFDTSSVTDMWHMFNGCTNLEKLNLSGFDTTNVTNMNCMFYQCTSLTELDLSFFDTKNVTGMEYMFSKCSNLKIIYVKELDGSGNAGWSTASIKNSNYMFLECEKIVGGNGTTYNAEHIDATYARIDTDGAPGYFTKKGQKPSEDVPTEPYLPTGFTKVEGTSLANGYTIQDSTGNQYVWVEVPKTSEVYPTAGLNITGFSNDEYAKIETDLHTYTKDYRKSGWEDEYYSDEATGLTSEKYTALKQKMLKSVYKNGGFYVGKYETGIESAPKTEGNPNSEPTENPVIKQNAYPYNNVTCSQAQTLASKMESGNYTSSLMFGVQWDLVLKYLETKGTAQADLKTNSTNWGNYCDNLWEITNKNSKYAIYTNYKLGDWTSGAYGKKDSNKSVLLSTGASETFSKQGIYDLAGNVWEWTLEYTANSSYPCAIRGGSYNNDGSIFPAASRNNGDTTFYNDGFGFRLSLY